MAPIYTVTLPEINDKFQVDVSNRNTIGVIRHAIAERYQVPVEVFKVEQPHQETHSVCCTFSPLGLQYKHHCETAKASLEQQLSPDALRELKMLIANIHQEERAAWQMMSTNGVDQQRYGDIWRRLVNMKGLLNDAIALYEPGKFIEFANTIRTALEKDSSILSPSLMRKMEAFIEKYHLRPEPPLTRSVLEAFDNHVVAIHEMANKMHDKAYEAWKKGDVDAQQRYLKAYTAGYHLARELGEAREVPGLTRSMLRRSCKVAMNKYEPVLKEHTGFVRCIKALLDCLSPRLGALMQQGMFKTSFSKSMDRAAASIEEIKPPTKKI